MNTAFIANQNANRIIFKDSKGPGIQSFKVCGDLLEDRGVREGIAGLLQHGVRAYLGVSMILEGGKVATLIVASNQPRTFSPEDISVAGEICACIEDRYRMRRETAITNTVSNLTISSVLLSSIKVRLCLWHPRSSLIIFVQVYLHTATTCMEAMDQIYIDITCPPMTAEEPSYASLPPTEGALSINQLSLGEGTSAVSMSRNASDAASLSKDAPAAPSNATPTPRSSFFKINQARDRGSTASLGVEALASSLQLPKSISATPNSSTPEPSIYHHAQNRTSTTVVVTKERQDSQWRKMQSLALRFEMLQGQIQDAIERALMVAQHYTSKNKNKYYISCFHAEASGFVEVSLPVSFDRDAP